MRNIVYIIFAILLLSSCKVAQKAVTEFKLDEDIEVNNDISIRDDNWLSEITDQIISRIVSEQLNIQIKKVRYDTDKPVDEESGKHPVSEETDININKQTDINETENKRQENNSITSFELQDNSEKTISTKQEITEERRVGLTGLQKGLIFIGLLSVIAVILYIIIKAKR